MRAVQAARRLVRGGGAQGGVEGEVNREFLYFQARYFTRALTAFLTQEIDFNREWRKELTGESYQISNVLFSGNYRFSEMLRLGLLDKLLEQWDLEMTAMHRSGDFPDIWTQ